MATYFNRDDSLLLKEDVLYVIVYLVGKALTISSTLQYVLLIQYCIQVYFYIPSETILYIQVIGVCVLAVGIAVQVQLKNYLELTQLYYENTAYIMIAIGVLILLVALAGFYCTAKDKIALLYMVCICTAPSTLPLYTIHSTLSPSTLSPSTLPLLHSPLYTPPSTLSTLHSPSTLPPLHSPSTLSPSTLSLLHCPSMSPPSTLSTLHYPLYTPPSTLSPLHYPLYTAPFYTIPFYTPPSTLSPSTLSLLHCPLYVAPFYTTLLILHTTTLLAYPTPSTTPVYVNTGRCAATAPLLWSGNT
ncbi:hypothetical protein EB796_004789 [Bugula neritina]|uniref:Uncharacterized protein n=1 Tax=Bugula neritina TaxID=10212 RepID=A0A7J7KG94_BUGNE|nr:hypothetical protein EB796_004789 [Bugula neritina]